MTADRDATIAAAADVIQGVFERQELARGFFKSAPGHASDVATALADAGLLTSPAGPATRALGRELFDVLVRVETDNCVIWPLSTSRGHGRFEEGGRTTKVHREALVLRVGPPPENKPHALHGPCHDRRCMNYRHLRWGDHSENMKDRARDGTCPDLSGPNASSVKLQPHELPRIIQAIEAGESQRTIALRHGVSQSTISLIKNGKRWDKHFDAETGVLIDRERAVIDAASRHQTRMIPTVAPACGGESPDCDHEDECPIVGETPVCGACYDDKLERDGEIWNSYDIKPTDCPICVAFDALTAERGHG